MPRPRLTARGSALVATALVLGALPTLAPAASADPAPFTDPVTDTPALVEGIAEPTTATGPADAAAIAHLAAKKDRYHIANPGRDLATAGVEQHDGTEVVRLNQRHHGVPVLGGQYVVRLQHDGSRRVVTGTSGKYFTDLTVPTAAAISADHAVKVAIAQVMYGPAGTGSGSLGGSGKADLTGADQGLVVLPEGQGRLARHVTVTGADASGAPVKQEVYVDAVNGHTALSYSGLQTLVAPAATSSAPAASAAAAGSDAATTPARGEGLRLDGETSPVDLTYDAAQGTYLLKDTTRASAGAIETYDARGQLFDFPNGTIPDGVELWTSPDALLDGELTESGAVDAHWGTAQVYDYFKSRFGRDSLDGEGMALRSLIGLDWNNAGWDGYQMVYGAGDGQSRKPFSAGLDVVGHELTHGVVTHTANLLYVGQSGAMNEAIADYFGNAIEVEVKGQAMDDPDASLLGEGLCYEAAGAACALRDLDDARTVETFGGYPFSTDNGGVHMNSTIFGGALWDVREALGGELADQIVYTALTQYLTPLDGFTEGRDAVVAAAKSLGVKGGQLNAVKHAFDAHGIARGWEKPLGSDATVLMENLGTGGDTGAGAGGGWWTAAQSPDPGYPPVTVWAGRIGGKGTPVALNDPAPDEYNAYPDTDGKTVAWSRWTPGGGLQIVARPLAGGPEVVVGTPSLTVWGVRVADGVVAWDDVDPETYERKVRYTRIGSGKVETLDGLAGQPKLGSGKLVSIHSFPDEPVDQWGRTAYGVEALDLATGVSTRIGPLTYGYTTEPTVAGPYAVWIAEELDGDGGALRRAALDGSGWTDIVPETEHGGLLAPFDITASDTAITVTESGQGRMGAVPVLRQYTLDGRPLGLVTCTGGIVRGADADTGSTVVFVDTSTSYDNLVVRTKPAGTCR